MLHTSYSAKSLSHIQTKTRGSETKNSKDEKQTSRKRERKKITYVVQREVGHLGREPCRQGVREALPLQVGEEGACDGVRFVYAVLEEEIMCVKIA